MKEEKNGTKNVQTTVLQTSGAELTQFNFFNPEHLVAIQRIAGMFASSELVPDMYKISANNPKDKAIANCTIAIDIAQRIGASILMVMQNLIIIYGRPSWSSKFLIATVNTCGRFNPLKYNIEDLGDLKGVTYTSYEWNDQTRKKESSQKTFNETVRNFRCIAYTTAKGDTVKLESSPITIELAIKEGWFTKSGSKWRTIPKQMLMYRAASFWTNVYAPELSMGMKTVEEEIDIEDIPFEEVIKTEIDENANKENIDINTGEITPAKEAAPKNNKPEPATAGPGF